MPIKECRNCGSNELYWSPHYKSSSDVPEGRLRTGEVRCFFVLGCDTCSETLKVISAADAAELLTEAMAPVAQAGQVPEGWKLVPLEPTAEMREAFHESYERYEDGVDECPDDQWKAMLAAAPAQGGMTDE